MSDQMSCPGQFRRFLRFWKELIMAGQGFNPHLSIAVSTDRYKLDARIGRYNRTPPNGSGRKHNLTILWNNHYFPTRQRLQRQIASARNK